MRTYYDMCSQLLAQGDRERYLATLYAPAEHRDALFAIFAFGFEVARIRDAAREPLAGEIRLQWWREVLHGERTEQALANPVSAALLDTIKKYDLPQAQLERLIDAHTFDLYTDPMPSRHAMEAYADETQGALLLVGGRILGVREAEFGKLAFVAAKAMTLGKILLRFGLHASRRQLYVPQDVLADCGVKREDVFARNATADLRAALAEMRQRVRQYLDEASQLRVSVSAAVLPLLLPAALVRPILSLMEKGSYDPFAPVEIAAWRRQWILWRAARNPAQIFN